jgi:hypothetical protein
MTSGGLGPCGVPCNTVPDVAEGGSWNGHGTAGGRTLSLSPGADGTAEHVCCRDVLVSVDCVHSVFWLV